MQVQYRSIYIAQCYYTCYLIILFFLGLKGLFGVVMLFH